MGTGPRLSPADLSALRAELIERQGLLPTPGRARAINWLGELLTDTDAGGFVFRMDRKGWRVGSGEGERLAPPSEAVGGGLSILHTAVASLGEPCPIPKGLSPNAARTRVTRARMHIAKRHPELAALLKHVRVSCSLIGAVLVTYDPPGNAPAIRTT